MHKLKFFYFTIYFICLFSFAQEKKGTSFYVNPNTVVFGLEHISLAHKQKPEHKDKPTLYIVENTIFNALQDFTIVNINNKTTHCNTTKKISM